MGIRMPLLKVFWIHEHLNTKVNSMLDWETGYRALGIARGCSPAVLRGDAAIES
jgi:hypothetical protein